MRRLLVSGFAALAVLLGLVVTTGVASAAPSERGCDHGVVQVLCGGGGVNTNSTTTVTPCGPGEHHVPGGACVADGVGFPGHHLPGGGGFGGGHWIPGGNIPWGGPSLYGHQLWVQANLGLDICGYGNSYDTFLNRNLRYRSDIDRLLDRGRWQSLYSSDCNSGLAVLPGGLNLVNGDLLNLDLLGLSGAGTVNVCSYPDWNTFDSRLGGRWGGRWGAVRNHFGGNAFNEFRQLRVNAHCTTVMLPSSTSIEPQETVTETATAEAPAPADPGTGDQGVSKTPLASGPIPTGAVPTGGDSPAWVLAHARVV